MFSASSSLRIEASKSERKDDSHSEGRYDFGAVPAHLDSTSI